MRALDARRRLESLGQHRALRRPFDLVHDRAREVDDLAMRASRAVRNNFVRLQDRVTATAARLESLSPLAVLRRGYSVTQRDLDGQVIRRSDEVTVGQTITSRLAVGRVISTVREIDNDQTTSD